MEDSDIQAVSRRCFAISVHTLSLADIDYNSVSLGATTMAQQHYHHPKFQSHQQVTINLPKPQYKYIYQASAFQDPTALKLRKLENWQDRALRCRRRAYWKSGNLPKASPQDQMWCAINITRWPSGNRDCLLNNLKWHSPKPAWTQDQNCETRLSSSWRLRKRPWRSAIFLFTQTRPRLLPQTSSSCKLIVRLYLRYLVPMISHIKQLIVFCALWAPSLPPWWAITRAHSSSLSVDTAN